MKERNNRKSGKRTVLAVVCVLLALILVGIVAFLMIWKDIMSPINRLEGSFETISSELEESIRNETDPTDPSFTGPVYTPEDATMPTEPVDTVMPANEIINILLVGQDRREGQGRQRSDSMILCTVNKSAKTLTMTSFLRDTWVRIPGRYDERLNVPYVIGGFSLLNETLEYNFGVSTDHFVEVDFSGFKKVIDLVGGVDISLSNAEANYLTSRREEWSFVKGENHLNGEQALDYARIRKLDNDLERSNRQRKVITALLEKAMTLDIGQLTQMIKSTLSIITTDMTDMQILGYVAELAPMLPQLTIASQRIPADGAYAFARIDGKSVIYLSPENLQKNIDILKNTIELSE